MSNMANVEPSPQLGQRIHHCYARILGMRPIIRTKEKRIKLSVHIYPQSPLPSEGAEIYPDHDPALRNVTRVPSPSVAIMLRKAVGIIALLSLLPPAACMVSEPSA